MSRCFLVVAAWLATPLRADGQTPEPPRVHTVLADASDVHVVTRRSGLLSFLGHEHAIAPLEWSAELCLDDPLSTGASGSVVLETASLAVDTDSVRALAGLGGGPGADDRATIRTRMLDAEHLHVDRFPRIRLDLVAAGGVRDGRFDARGTITVRDVTRVVRLPVRIERPHPDGVVLSGSLRIRQSDFGIAPESVAGVVNVADGVDLYFRLVARSTEETCRLAPVP